MVKTSPDKLKNIGAAFSQMGKLSQQQSHMTDLEALFDDDVKPKTAAESDLKLLDLSVFKSVVVDVKPEKT